MKTNHYKVAEHIFTISIAENHALWDYLSAYEPFLIDKSESDSSEKLFSLTLCNEVKHDDRKLIINAEDHKEIGFPGVGVFSTTD